jgi:hypothetical protein
MIPNIVHIKKEQLDASFLENLHSTTFDFYKSGDDFRVDGGYAVQEQDGNLSGYVLYREISNKVIDLAYGASDKDYKGFRSVKNLNYFIELMFQKYEVITTMVWNKNYKMLKIYMALGFDVVGTKLSHKGGLFVLLEKEVKKEIKDGCS